MPVNNEQVFNKALSGSEVKDLLRRDFDRLLSNFGELADYVAYGRLDYKILLTIGTGNAFRPEVTGSVDATISISAYELERIINSPNEERVRAGMPVPIKKKSLDGTVTTEMVQYPAQPELGEGQVKTTDVTERENKKIKVI